MLSENDQRIAQAFQRRLATAIPLYDLRVFGSRARGDATPESDLDIFVGVESLTPEIRRRISEIAWAVGFEMDQVISTFVATRQQVEEGMLAASPLVQAIQREGVRP
jgi:predicted nucleotidyltransferase